MTTCIYEPTGNASITADVTNNTFAATNGDHLQTVAMNSVD